MYLARRKFKIQEGAGEFGEVCIGNCLLTHSHYPLKDEKGLALALWNVPDELTPECLTV